MSEKQVLSDIRVLDLTESIAGPYAGKLFADYGADVIKIETPEGDPSRREGPFLDDEPNPETSALFLHLNRNKRGITLDLDARRGQQLFRELVSSADIVLESFGPGTMEKWELGWEELKTIKEELVFGRLSPFGQSGPYKDYRGNDLIYFAWGTMLGNGDYELGPVRKALHAVECSAGQVFAIACMGAFLAARYQELGQEVDVAAAETELGSIDFRLTTLLGYQYHGNSRERREEPPIIPMDVQPCADGFVHLATVPTQLPRALEVVGASEMAERVTENPALAYDDEFQDQAGQAVSEWLLSHKQDEIVEKAQAKGWPVVPVNTIEDLIHDEHFNEREFFVDVEHPVAGTQTYTGSPWNMEKGGFQSRRPAPLLGQHNMEIYGEELDLDRSEIVRLRHQGVI